MLAHEQKAMVSWSTFFDDVLDYLENEAPELWRKVFRPLIQGVVIDQGKRWAGILGMTFDVKPLFARDWYNRYIEGFPIPIIDTTKSEIGTLVDLAMNEGWSIPNMQNAITEAFDIWADYRTERIARTETMRAANAGTTELFQEWGVRRQEWLSTKDDRTRESPPDEFDHVQADGEVVNICEPFMATGEPLMYPGDPAGSAGNTINCRCTVIPVVEGME